MKKERLDILVQHQAGLTRSQAQGIIRAGKVLSQDGRVLDKPGLQFPTRTTFEILQPPRYVSRGGEKLEAALEQFGVSVDGAIAIDVGASTGGFTDCLLKHGAARVYAIDVGYGQLAWELRQDPRVILMERTNIRHLSPSRIPERPTFFTADCSFISLRLVLPPLRAVVADNAEGIVLIKPQFEAGRKEVGKGGVVRDGKTREKVVSETLDAAAGLGFASLGVMPSPLLGPAGNVEYLAHLRVINSP